MATHTVTLRIVPSLDVECRFWYQDGGWNGRTDCFSLSVRADSFEQVKNEMASALGKHMETILHGSVAKAHVG
jgi:hypothetical protein